MDPKTKFIQGLQSFGGNAWNDIKNIGAGLWQLPGTIANAYDKSQSQIAGDTNPVTKFIRQANPQLGMAQNFGLPVAKGVVNEYADLATHPIKHAYEHPVNTALDILPFVGPVTKALKGANTVAPATAEEASIIAPLKSVPKPEGGVLPEIASVRKLEVPSVSDAAANSYMKPYTIPAGLDVKPLETAKWMIKDKPNLSQLDGFMNTVENIKQSVLKNASEKGVQVNIDPATGMGAKELTGIPSLDPAKIPKYQSELSSLYPSKMTSAEGTIGGADAMQTYKSIKTIEQKGYIYLDAGQDRYGNITNLENYKVGQAYINTAKELETSLDSAINGADILAQYKTSPAITNAIAGFSKGVADRFTNSVQNWSDLRALQAPYVNMSKIINYTNKAGHSAFANLSGRAVQLGTAGAGAGIGGAIAGAPGAMVGATIGTLAEPFVSALGNKILPPLTANMAGIAEGAGKVVGESAQLAKNVAPALPQLSENALQGNGQQATENKNPNPGANQVQGNGENIQTTHTISTIPQTIDEVKPDPTGNYPVADPYQIKGADGQSLALSGNDYQVNIDQLNKAKAAAFGNPKQQGIIQGQIDSLNTKYAVSKDIQDNTKVVNSLNEKASEARRLLALAPPNLFSLYPTVEKLRQATDPNYKALGEAFAVLGKDYPLEITSGMTPQSALAALDQINKTFLNDYYQELRNYMGNQGQSPGAQPSQLPASNVAATLAPPSGGSLPAMEGGWKQALPPNPTSNFGWEGQ